MTDATDMHYYPVYKETGEFTPPELSHQRNAPILMTVIAVVAFPLQMDPKGLNVIVEAIDTDSETFQRKSVRSVEPLRPHSKSEHGLSPTRKHPCTVTTAVARERGA